MKINKKIFNKIDSGFVLNIVCIAFVGIFIYMVARTVSPILPKPLSDKIKICDIADVSSWKGEWSQIMYQSRYKELRETLKITYDSPPEGGVMFWCKTFIPIEMLLRAATINVELETNQQLDVKVALYRKNSGGPDWEKVTIAGGKEFTISHPLDKPNQKKMNWLVAPHENMAFMLTSYDPKKAVIIKILDTYLR